MQLVRDDCQSQIVSIAICLTISGAHVNILCITKVKILELINPPSMMEIEPRVFNKF
jgi:hypothetical protein